MQLNHFTSAEVGLSGTMLFVIIGKLFHEVEPHLADISYGLAAIASIITIYYKLKNKS